MKSITAIIGVKPFVRLSNYESLDITFFLMKNKIYIKLILILSFVFMNSFLYGQRTVNKIKPYDRDLNFEICEYFRNDSLICTSNYDTITNREVFLTVEERPYFGDSISYRSAIMSYLAKNTYYPINQLCETGKVIVQFIVQIDGTLTDFTIIRGLYPDYDEEALKALRKMPKWTPGKCNGEKVPVYYIVPVEFGMER